MSPTALADQIRNWVRVITKIPFLAVIVLALIMQATKEFYPFSHYPMYSDLPPSVEYYYLTTSKGRAASSSSLFWIFHQLDEENAQQPP